MRLLDSVVQATGPVIVDLPGSGRYLLPGAAARAEALADCPERYVLGDDVRATCSEIVRRWPALLDPVDPHLRIGSGRLWIEWSEPDAAVVAAPRSQPCGLLATIDASGRRGSVESFWLDPLHGVDRGQGQIDFDLDQPLARRIDNRRTFALPAAGPLAALAPHALFRVDPGWLDYFEAPANARMPVPVAVAQCLRTVWRDLPLLLAFSRLRAARPDFRTQAVSRGRLNAARARQGKPALLDHVELSLQIGTPAVDATRIGGGRRDARLHLVRGHVVNRSGRLFWRSAHLRGRADLPRVLSRTATVSLAPRFAVEGARR
ncbi:hypothetical protein [Sphingomonas sanxanigenens]|uniref:Uncharacterized protein n=1 Tax=Sphingomonas sanxanigenens DSM 19645 = NX02 TaxID=1123269 RepID=W0AJY6_9SPHN|nr:hypothetical protein [Sphingomonas sanxanigenens]AHE56598.1 hypothetical protein NX02_24955 [Sphingomonas sanxanigenens DSM 19645 = NX02]